LVLLSTAHLRADATPGLDEAKRLYASAAYDDALRALEGLGASASSDADVQEYRALCLMALGRSGDAARAAEALVAASPLRIPSADEFPPRFVALVSETRQRVLPVVARRLYASGREQYHGDMTVQATETFQRVLAILDDPVMRTNADAPDLRTLAMGYLDLLEAKQARSQPAAVPASAPTQPRPQASFVAAKPLRQDFPAWVPSKTTDPSLTLHGMISIRIGTDGRVKALTVVEPTLPAYDARLRDASREWTYEPATYDGAPVESMRVLSVELKPTR
jgi:hypothetical protein